MQRPWNPATLPRKTRRNRQTYVSETLGFAIDLINSSFRSAARTLPKARLTYLPQLDCAPDCSLPGQWIESVTDWAIRITDWCLSTDWTSSRARLLDPIRPMPDNGSFEHPGSPIALISRLPDWAVQSVLPIAIPPIAPSILSTGQHITPFHDSHYYRPTIMPKHSLLQGNHHGNGPSGK